MLEPGLLLFCVDDHAAELVHRKETPVQTVALLPKKHRSIAGQLDADRNQSEQWGQQCQAYSGDQNVGDALEHQPRIVHHVEQH